MQGTRSPGRAAPDRPLPRLWGLSEGLEASTQCPGRALGGPYAEGTGARGVTTLSALWEGVREGDGSQPCPPRSGGHADRQTPRTQSLVA